MQKNISLILSVVLTVCILPYSNIHAQDEEWIYTDHDTYFDTVTGIEYEMESNLPVSEEHASSCSFYEDYLASLKEEESIYKEEIQNEEAIESVTESLTVPTLLTQPASISSGGYQGNVYSSILEENYVTSNWDLFSIPQNPFSVGQCTYFAWTRFYQTYGYDSGARGHGKENVYEIVSAHSDLFEISKIPATGATYSIEQSATLPQYGHVGFIEYFDGEYLWISEGNVEVNGVGENIWFHKEKWEDFKNCFPDVVFAIPKRNIVLKVKLQPMKEFIRKY